MADINQVISLGIGSPSGIPEFLTFGLQIGAAVVDTLYIVDGDVPIRITALDDVAIRTIASGNAAIRIIGSGDVEL